MRLPKGWKKLHQGKTYTNYTNGNLGVRVEHSHIRRQNTRYAVITGHVEGFGKHLSFVAHDVIWVGSTKAQAEKVATDLMRFEMVR